MTQVSQSKMKITTVLTLLVVRIICDNTGKEPITFTMITVIIIITNKHEAVTNLREERNLETHLRQTYLLMKCLSY